MKAFFSKGWVSSLIAFLALQLTLLFFETTWSPKFRDMDGTLFGKLSETALFTEWFVPYDTPLFNLFSAFFAIVLLPYTIIGVIRELFFKKQATSR